MKCAALAVLLVACGGEAKPSAPVQGSASAAPKPVEQITAQLAGCSPALSPPFDPREVVSASLGPGAVRVELEAPSVTGQLDRTTVRRYLLRRTAKFRGCYERELLAKPTLAGAIEASFAITTRGTVASATATGVDPAVAKCIADEIKTIEFTKPTDNNNVQVTVRLDLQNPNATDPTFRPTTRRVRIAREWTPYAIDPMTDDATLTATETTAVVRQRMTAIEQCFDGARGVVRALIEIDTSGKATTVRAGGIGDSAIERCIASALGGFTVSFRSPSVEIACDFIRGGDAPLRVSPDAGYTLIELTNREVRNRSSVREIPPRGSNRGVTMLGGSAAVLVVADPDAPAHGLEYALWWAPAGTTLVAVKASGGAPVFLGMGDSRAQRVAATEKRVVQLRTDGRKLRACVAGSVLTETADLLDPRAMDRVMQSVVAACKQTPCEPTVVVGTSGEFIAKDLVATTSAARRAGFHAISIGGPACD